MVSQFWPVLQLLHLALKRRSRQLNKLGLFRSHGWRANLDNSTLQYEIRNAIGQFQPLLRLTAAKKGWLIGGKFIVREDPWKLDDKGPIDHFEVEIFIPRSYPRKEPSVIEKGGKIPRHPDRHMNGKHGECCLCIWEIWLAAEIENTIEEFLNGPVHQFFLGQLYYEKHKKWPFGEQAHYKDGVVEATAQLLGVKQSERTVRTYLEHLARDWPKGHMACACGSGKKLRNCCREELWSMHNKIPSALAKAMLAKLPKPNRSKRRKRH